MSLTLVSPPLYHSIAASLSELTLRSREAIVELVEALRVDEINVTVQRIRLPEPVQLSSRERVRACKDVSSVPAACKGVKLQKTRVRSAVELIECTHFCLSPRHAHHNQRRETGNRKNAESDDIRYARSSGAFCFLASRSCPPCVIRTQTKQGQASAARGSKHPSWQPQWMQRRRR